PASAKVATDPLTGIDDFLKPAAPAQTAQTRALQGPPAPVQVAYNAPVPRSAQPARSASGSPPGKIWLQLASGSNASSLPSQFDRIKSHNSELMQGIK